VGLSWRGSLVTLSGITSGGDDRGVGGNVFILLSLSSLLSSGDLRFCERGVGRRGDLAGGICFGRFRVSICSDGDAGRGAL
jgi:hypothetical protein